MFFSILLFEIRNRVRRPALYLYFLTLVVFTTIAFATGSVPLQEKEHINAPYLIAFWSAGMTMMMMLVSSSIMGTALYRDIEHNTKDYYLTYPITKAGYFWGRFTGSFLCMIILASGIYLGIYLGSILGPITGNTDASQYGPNHLPYYLHSFLSVAMPNIFFTSALFFGLVAVMRNIKVIYFGGILLFLFYFLSIFFLNTTQNETVITIADPFGLNGVRFQTANSSFVQQNTQLIPLQGAFLVNRLLWSGIGLAVLLITYFTFSFERFFSGKRDNVQAADEIPSVAPVAPRAANVSFTGSYKWKTFLSLTRLEALNILRDNYFWMIMISGSSFLAFVFWLGNRWYGVEELPRTVVLLGIFNDVFPFFLFFILLFYTGEILHRDRVSRYAFISDSLPPPNRIMNASKLIPLMLLAVIISFLPVVIGTIVQLVKGYHRFNFSVYTAYVFAMLLPKLLETVVFCYLVHVIVNNKFVAHGIAAAIWIGVFFLHDTGTFNYNLLMYSYTPSAAISEMDGIGHMMGPINWFNLYWLLIAALLLVVCALFYHRGVNTSLKERMQLVPVRFDRRTIIFAITITVLFLPVAAFDYYNVSYLNNFLTKSEQGERAVIYERSLKHYDSLPLPKMVSVKLLVDLYPEKQEVHVKAFVMLANKTARPIPKLLLDAGALTDYSITLNGILLPYISPLVYDRGKFNWLRPAKDTAEFRLYTLPTAMMPGDSIKFELNGEIIYRGFQNDRYATNLLRNGIFFNGGLPGLGYDEDEELSSPYERKKHHLPFKKEEDIALDDPIGIRTLKAGNATDLLKTDITVSTSIDQTVAATGELIKRWTKNGRNYCRFVQNEPGSYPPFAIVSARYTIAKDTVQLKHPVAINVLYHAPQSGNVPRLIQAYKDGLKYLSNAYGDYPSDNITLAETSVASPRETSLSTLNTLAEYNCWNAHFTDQNQFDYCYFKITRLLSQQWWRYQVAPNATTGSLVISEGIATYDALVMAEKKYGKNNIRGILLEQLGFYLFIRRRLEGTEHPLIRANESFEWSDKAGVVLYCLRDLIGENKMNIALRDFKEQFAFRNGGPYAGSNDLYNCLQKQVPDSLKYFLSDSWQKLTLYDNKIIAADAYATSKKDEFKVVIELNVDKVYVEADNKELPATAMNDYIDVAVFGQPYTDANGVVHKKPLYIAKHKLTRGAHKFAFIVSGKPVTAAVDPYALLIDRSPANNLKEIEFSSPK